MRFKPGREYIFLWVSRTSLVNGATRMYRDALTRVKNKNAYMGWEAKHNDKIKNGTLAPLAIVVCDLNELKEVNDTLGHRAGDEYIKKASSIICNIFVHSQLQFFITVGAILSDVEEEFERANQWRRHEIFLFQLKDGVLTT